jgi:glycosyltransferase involved in cell wall biosynthesis
VSAAGLGPEVPLVVLASAPFETPTPVNAHQIARRFAARGHRVLFVESTGLRRPALLRSGADRRRVLARARGFLRGVREAAPNLHVLAPVALPADLGGLARTLSDRFVAGRVAAAARGLGFARPVVWALLPTALPTARRLAGRCLVYHCVDHYAANPGVDAARVDAAERALVAAADLVLASSPALAERLARQRPDVTLVANVADVELFARAAHERLPEPAALAGLPRPRAVYAGNVAAYRVDLALLTQLADALPELQLVLVGPVGLGDGAAPPAALAALRARPNVRVFDARPQAELPAWLAHADVALLPFLDNAHTRSSLPLKLWEYVAAGLPVVATALPQLAALERDGVLVTAKDAAGFAAALRAALSEPPRRAERSARARGHDWAARIDELSALVAARAGDARVQW